MNRDSVEYGKTIIFTAEPEDAKKAVAGWNITGGSISSSSGKC
mgnify:CR=1 FL=1